MDENTDEQVIPVATLVVIQPNTIIPIRIIEVEVVGEVSRQICSIS